MFEILTILIYLIAIEHLGIMALEMWGRPEQQARAFGMPITFVRQVSAQKALANQGIYNGMLAVILILAQWLLPMPTRLITTALLLGFIVIVALYGSLTVKRQIFWLQGFPALVALIILLSQLI
ncbi:DUF1304 domain-containing protein [Levilactobacillus brevis]|uniref:DUF1304 domain-containing protein n=1 Tax=Levilactobacillus brevis TaxID=1580 RepID=A0AA41JTU4_LEVBR|nr:DUF1304 domain-containing protein [Levilactobacillus brevis]MBS0948221.1 DUF1304 domain-containing protein [Levilactobacillus brevis]MBS1011390.1 DUF1304 domain-containing protein [Levilactobacillus brevis]